MDRYRSIFNNNFYSQNVKHFSIKNRPTDVHITFNSEDTFYNISNRYYGSPEYWWIILNANNYAIEFDVEYGEIVRVPLPLSDVLSEIGSSVK